MIQPGQIKNYFPTQLRDNPAFQKYFMKVYIQLLILDLLTTTPWIRKLSFIGGTNLRLVKGIDCILFLYLIFFGINDKSQVSENKIDFRFTCLR